VSLIGPSGCGKSTLLRVIGDLVQPSAGDVLVNGKSPQRARLDRDYGMVFQAPVLFDWRSVEDNVKLPLEIQGRPSGERAARAKEMLDLVELGEFAKHMPYQLSGGMQQRVGLVRALVMNPSILLMDEPFAALDAQTREILQEELLALMERPDERKTMVFITHSIDEAILLGDRIAVMSARPGRIKEVLNMPFGWPRQADAVRSDPRFAEIRVHIWHQLHTVKPSVRAPREVA
jgi:NitT/TauT family transport system ATP-binding protein